MKIKKLLLAAAIILASARAADPPTNVIVYREAGRFGGWPANNGIWVWGDEIVVGYIQGYFRNNERGHAIDAGKPEVFRPQ